MDILISLNIKYLLSENRLTQKELGDLFELPTSAVNAYVNGKSLPKMNTILSICKHFDINVGDFITENLKELDKRKRYPASPSMEEAVQMQVNEQAGIYGLGDVVAGLKAQIADKNKLIAMLEGELERVKELPVIPAGEISSKLSKLISASEDSAQLEAAIAQLARDMSSREAKAVKKSSKA